LIPISVLILVQIPAIPVERLAERACRQTGAEGKGAGSLHRLQFPLDRLLNDDA
jgi:hypothetical protein